MCFGVIVARRAGRGVRRRVERREGTRREVRRPERDVASRRGVTLAQTPVGATGGGASRRPLPREERRGDGGGGGEGWRARGGRARVVSPRGARVDVVPRAGIGRASGGGGPGVGGADGEKSHLRHRRVAPDGGERDAGRRGKKERGKKTTTARETGRTREMGKTGKMGTGTRATTTRQSLRWRGCFVAWARWARGVPDRLAPLRFDGPPPSPPRSAPTGSRVSRRSPRRFSSRRCCARIRR